MPTDRTRDEVPTDDEQRRRERHTSAFAGCIHGGASALLAQLAGSGGGDELLVQGAGIWIATDHPDDPLRGVRSKPIVYCHPTLITGTEGELVLASDHPRLLQYLGYVTGGEQPPRELLAFGTDAAIEDWTPGSRVNGSSAGTLGATCTSQGSAAILTAGHVTDGAPTVTIGAMEAKVRYQVHAGTSTIPLAIGPDLAVVERPPGQGGSQELIPRAGRVGPSEPLRLFNGTTSANVLALATFLRVVDRSGCWGDVYHLDGSIGSHGDSGAAVVDVDGLLVGHYLGRLAGMAVVQDVSYQAGELAKTGTTIP